jgi:hypothetical protein
MYCVLTCNQTAHVVLWLSVVRARNVLHWIELLRLDGSKLISGMLCYVMSPSVVCTGQYGSKGKERLQEQRVRWRYVK